MTGNGPRGRILVSKLGLDGHDVGAKVVSRFLRDAGFEVVYLGIRQTATAVAAVARDEDVDLIGISVLSGAHLSLVGRLLDLLREDSVPRPVVVGGVIPPADRAELEAMGVAAVFDASTTRAEIVQTVTDLLT